MNEMTALPAAVRAALNRVVNDGLLAGALSLVWHDGETVLCEAAGHRDIAQGRAMDREAIFQIASMTKPIVSVAALQLVDEGKVQLDDPIARWLPEFGSPRVIDDPTGPLERSHPAARPITVDDLLTHRAGFTYAFLAPGPIGKALEPVVENILRPTTGPDAWLASLARLPLLREPGAQFEYGHSTEVLGCLLARIDGTSLGDSLARRVFHPLGMNDTAFYAPADKRARLAHRYRRDATGLVDVTNAPATSPVFEAGGGGLYSTAGDYLTFARMLLSMGEVDGVRVLSAAMCEQLGRNHLTAYQRTLEALSEPTFFASTGFGYGVAVEVDPVPPLHMSPGTLSWGGIWGTNWRADPRRRLITLFFTQDDADTSSDADRAAAAVRPAKLLQAEIEQVVFGAISPLNNRI